MSCKVFFIFFFIVLNTVQAIEENFDYYNFMREYNEIEERNFTMDYSRTIFPGTKWCGAGNISPDGNSLGLAASTDACCRAHDRCPDVIPAGQTKYGLTNTAFYTRLNCDCDQTFYSCLKGNGDKISNTVGKIYFNTLNTKCYKNEYPIVMCRRFADIFGKKCLDYELNTSLPKQYQWFDVPKY